MTEFIALELPINLAPFEQSDIVQILNYDYALHHALIPKIYAESFEDNPWPDDWDTIDEFDPKGVFLATEKNKSDLAGFVISFKRRNFGYISVVAVLPSSQRRGIATALIKEAVRYLKSLGLNRIRIHVEETNLAALQVYERLGFKFVAKVKK